MTLQDYQTKLERYTTTKGAEYIAPIIFSEQSLKLRIVSPRKTKMGDYRPPHGRKKPYHQITINNDLGEAEFLLTLLHEYSHLLVWKQWENKVLPHGYEWKMTFKNILKNAIEKQSFSVHDSNAIIAHYFNNKVPASGRCPGLHIPVDSGAVTVESLPLAIYFVIGNKIYKKGAKRRTRYSCTEYFTGAKYSIHANASVYQTFTEEEIQKLKLK